MHLAVDGHPLHTRALQVRLVCRADGRIDVRGYVLDVRKRGFVPVGGHLQGSGIVHHMTLHAILDPATATVESIAAEQPSVAFEPSAVTAGESCRDARPNLAALVGARMDDTWPRRLSEAYGGARGCSHLLTLAQLVGSTTAWALARDRERHGTAPAWAADELIFRRDVIADGHEPETGRLMIALQLSDLHHTPAPARAPTMVHLGEAFEIRLAVPIDLDRYVLGRAALGERRRERDTLQSAPWVERTDLAQALEGLPVGRGASSAIRTRFENPGHDRPHVDAFLQLAPTLIQIYAAMSEPWAALAEADGWLVGIAGFTDSCYMWRRGGALAEARAPGDPPSYG